MRRVGAALEFLQVVGRVEVECEVVVMQHVVGETAEIRFLQVRDETAGTVVQDEVDRSGHRQHVRAVDVPVRDQGDLARHGDVGEGGYERQVGVRDEDVVRTIGPGLHPAIVHRAVQARRDLANHPGTECLGPPCDVVTRAHHVHGCRGCRSNDPLGTRAGEGLSLEIAKCGGQASLGDGERLHRHDHCEQHIGQPTNTVGTVTYAVGMTAMRMAVVGAGSWGTTVASLAAENTPTTLWARRGDVADEINRTHRNSTYLKEIPLSGNLRASTSLEVTVGTADVVVMAVPSHGFREVLSEAAPHIRPWVPVVSLSKGLEQGTLLRMSEVANEVLPGHPVAVLTGPNLAGEIAAGQPAASVVAIDDSVIATALQGIFSRPTFRVYTNADVVGCELAGVVKNVIAIASGISTGMGFGDNTRATLITRGLAEMTRLAMKMGGSLESLAGLAGMGDLIATCSSTSSRNTTVGIRLGKGERLADIIASTSQVAEGVKSSRAVLDLARKHGVDMPITEQVVAICHEGVSAADGLLALMTRQSRPEIR